MEKKHMNVLIKGLLTSLLLVVFLFTGTSSVVNAEENVESAFSTLTKDVDTRKEDSDKVREMLDGKSYEEVRALQMTLLEKEPLTEKDKVILKVVSKVQSDLYIEAFVTAFVCVVVLLAILVGVAYLICRTHGYI